MPPALTHLALHVRDLEATVRFYEDLCELHCIHRRGEPSQPGEVAWLAEAGRERDFILVLIGGGPTRSPPARDFSHLGFAVGSRDAVDRIAARGQESGCLVWAPREEPYPVGNAVEFSYGQPLGPGAEALDATLLADATPSQVR
jgi:catechol 2,3-dioxygenase-like lactoylglutathione lyase family enzyme